jgi:hypothetical protein
VLERRALSLRQDEGLHRSSSRVSSARDLPLAGFSMHPWIMSRRRIIRSSCTWYIAKVSDLRDDLEREPVKIQRHRQDEP